MVGKMEIVVEIDSKGRIVIPSNLRRGLTSKRMILRKVDDHLELIPLPNPASLKGKYRIEGSMEDIEELQEQKLLERV
ncbi:AbrB/MazE/SpoVT family DNA-binding domain-containing protein [Candidatus Bathyarchaeota archaeon]|nr:AbrB/MazE/SpoVT family DNA-binding domain-containing protein [Candidatus Bathyarchaeota archaeon]